MGKLAMQGTPSPAPSQPSQMAVLLTQKQEAENETVRIGYLTQIVKAWPRDALADRLIGIGLGALGSGGAAFVVAGYPSFEEWERWVPTVAAWTVGTALLIWGLSRLLTYSRTQLGYFIATFRVEEAFPKGLPGQRRK